MANVSNISFYEDNYPTNYNCAVLLSKDLMATTLCDLFSQLNGWVCFYKEQGLGHFLTVSSPVIPTYVLFASDKPQTISDLKLFVNFTKLPDPRDITDEIDDDLRERIRNLGDLSDYGVTVNLADCNYFYLYKYTTMPLENYANVNLEYEIEEADVPVDPEEGEVVNIFDWDSENVPDYTTDEDTLILLCKDPLSQNFEPVPYGSDIGDHIVPLHAGYYGSGGISFGVKQNAILKVIVMCKVPIERFYASFWNGSEWTEKTPFMETTYSTPKEYELTQFDLTDEIKANLHSLTPTINDGGKFVSTEVKLENFKHIYCFEFTFTGTSSNGFDVWHPNITYVKGEAPTPPTPESPSEFAFVNIYNPTFSQLKEAANSMFINFGSGETINISQYIVSLIKVFVPVTTAAEEVNIKFGRYQTNVQTLPITKRISKVSCGKITIPEQYANALDYSPYTTAKIWLPFLGFFDISINEIMNKEIELTYKIDLINGKALAELSSDDGVVYRFVGTAYEQEPYYTVQSANISTAYINGAYNMAEYTPYILLDRPIDLTPKNTDLMGNPSYKIVTVGDCKGYLHCVKVYAKDMIATEAEKQEIESLLMSGVLVD